MITDMNMEQAHNQEKKSHIVVETQISNLEKQIPELFFKEEVDTSSQKSQVVFSKPSILHIILLSILFIPAFFMLKEMFFTDSNIQSVVVKPTGQIQVNTKANNIEEDKTENIAVRNYITNREVRDTAEKITTQLLSFDYTNYKRNIINTDDVFANNEVMRKYLSELKESSYIERVKNNDGIIIPKTDVPNILESYSKDNELGFIVEVPVQETWVSHNKKTLYNVSVMLKLISKSDKPKDLLVSGVKITQLDKVETVHY